MTPTFGGLLAQFVNWLIRLLPVVIVQEWEQGVRMRNGRATALLDAFNGLRGSGFHFYWPLIGFVLTRDVLTRVDETNVQTLVTKDGTAATVAIGVRWQIRDLRALVTKVMNPEDNVVDVVRGALGDTIPTLLWTDLPSRLTDAVLAEARKRVRGWGVEITHVYLVTLAAAPVLRLLTDQQSDPLGKALAAHVETA